tara:strand:- start:885 stop:1031 length:147 start_codon:yes stop_codon:yes gene_type:complete
MSIKFSFPFFIKIFDKFSLEKKSFFGSSENMWFKRFILSFSLFDRLYL